MLINPPRFGELIGKNPALVEKHRGYNPPLGLLQLAGYVEAHTAHRVDVLDTQPPGYTYSQLRGVLARMSFDVVGITAMTFTLIDVIKTCQLVRTVAPRATIVLGGPHVHLYPTHTIRRDEVDFLIQGEGEIAFADFLDKLHQPDQWSSVPGLVFLDKQGSVHNAGIAPSTSDLDALGFPARHKVDSRDYNSLLAKDDFVTTMFTSRGCPFRCTFCDRPFSPVISGFRWRTAKHVADEMELCCRMGIHEAFIYDDTFTVRKERVYELCDEIKRRRLNFRWDVRAHVNTVSVDLLRAMRDAGCARIHFGVEVGNDRMLRVIRKNTTVRRVRDAFRFAAEVGIERLAYFIVGQQTETTSDLNDTIRLAQDLDPEYAHFTVFCPYPGTAIYREGLARGIIREDVWGAFSLDPEPGFVLPVWEENFTREQLQEILVKCYKKFYLRPRYLARSISKIRRTGELRRKVRAGISLLRMTPRDRL